MEDWKTLKHYLVNTFEKAMAPADAGAIESEKRVFQTQCDAAFEMGKFQKQNVPGQMPQP
ncbi:hypothetical protein [uncultured Desulfovibrio sp.]|uniref:hypothetical protein n=1 Tax=uncultured Desulfovibrio sp. TaxID=167968 RepID=UPI00272D18DB|nr:hypothetical protein [uncultured Desulfovibrio sp.]